MSLKINIDLKELYQKLTPECKKQLLQYIKEKLDEAMLEQMILGSTEEAKKEKGDK
ncbi:MAG: hypothetical protein LM558_00255 [Thermosphaera sp.]|nr:hypothetical protein [Thermosphaera sp.]